MTKEEFIRDVVTLLNPGSEIERRAARARFLALGPERVRREGSGFQVPVPLGTALAQAFTELLGEDDISGDTELPGPGPTSERIISEMVIPGTAGKMKNYLVCVESAPPRLTPEERDYLRNQMVAEMPEITGVIFLPPGIASISTITVKAEEDD